VKGTSSPGYWKKGKAVHFWEAWATYENAYHKKTSIKQPFHSSQETDGMALETHLSVASTNFIVGRKL
jgi:hypothetical protein